MEYDELELSVHLNGNKGGRNPPARPESSRRAAAEHPQLAERLDLSQPTLDRHLTTLQENGLIEKRSAALDAPYLITRRARANWDDVEELLERVEQPATPLLGIIAV